MAEVWLQRLKPVTSRVGRVFGHRHPHAAHTDQLRTVHSQRGNRRTASRCQADDFGGPFIPPEMVGPSVSMRVKQRCAFLRLWINGGCTIRFVSVTRGARKTYVPEDGLSTSRARQDVFEFKDGDRKLFRRTAIGATVGEMCADLVTQIGGEIYAHVSEVPAC